MRAQRSRIDRCYVRDNIDLPKTVLRPFVDREGHDDTLVVGVGAGIRAHAHVGIAMRAAEAAKEIAVGVDTLGIVDIVIEQKAQHVRLAGFDHALELLGRIGVVSGERHPSHRELVAFLDLEHEVGAAVLVGDGFRIDRDAEITVQAIELDDADDVVVHQRTAERAAGFRLQGLPQIFVFDLFVALEGEPRDARIFHDGDDNALALTRDLDVFEQAGAVEALDRHIERGGIE
jgi:hypothetical protein